MRPDDGVVVGQLRRQVKLGSEAVYRVCSRDGAYIDVEVVRAPGLRPGQHFKFTRAAVASMDTVSGGSEAPGS